MNEQADRIVRAFVFRTKDGEDAENNLFTGVKLRDGGGRWQ